MDIQKFKNRLELNQLDDQLLIFVCKKDNFIAHQYIRKIAQNRNLKTQIVDEIIQSSFDFEDDTLNILYLDKLDSLDKFPKNYIIITEKLSKKIDYSNVVEIPKVESWMLDNYIQTQLDGVDQGIVDAYKKSITDPYKAESEADKINIFNVQNRNQVVKDLINSNSLRDFIINKTIFDFSNAIFDKNIDQIVQIYKNIEYCDIEPLGLVQTIYRNVFNMINVVMQNRPTEENTGLRSNQIYAIRKSASRFTRDQLIKMFDFISQIDYKFKSGLLPENMIVDYIVVNILSIIK